MTAQVINFHKIDMNELTFEKQGNTVTPDSFVIPDVFIDSPNTASAWMRLWNFLDLSKIKGFIASRYYGKVRSLNVAEMKKQHFSEFLTNYYSYDLIEAQIEKERSKGILHPLLNLTPAEMFFRLPVLLHDTLKSQFQPQCLTLPLLYSKFGVDPDETSQYILAFGLQHAFKQLSKPERSLLLFAIGMVLYKLANKEFTLAYLLESQNHAHFMAMTAVICQKIDNSPGSDAQPENPITDMSNEVRKSEPFKKWFLENKGLPCFDHKMGIASTTYRLSCLIDFFLDQFRTTHNVNISSIQRVYEHYGDDIVLYDLKIINQITFRVYCVAIAQLIQAYNAMLDQLSKHDGLGTHIAQLKHLDEINLESFEVPATHEVNNLLMQYSAKSQLDSCVISNSVLMEILSNSEKRSKYADQIKEIALEASLNVAEQITDLVEKIKSLD